MDQEEITTGKAFAKGGGKETLFRVTLRNQLRMIGLIDQKASMIVTVSTLIVTISLGLLGGNLVMLKSEALVNFRDEMPFFVLVVFEILAILFALISTQSEMLLGKKKVLSSPMQFTLIRDRSINIDMFLERMSEILSSNEELYQVLSVDTFFLRKVILRKRFYLNISYLLFILGFIISIILFLNLYLVK